jgi:lipid-binding SYLF domain-containing protein
MRYVALLLSFLGLGAMAFAGGKTQADQHSDITSKLENATQIVQQITGPNAKAGIPESVLQRAKCIAVVPDLFQAGFMVGGRHGSGVASCRTNGNQWTSPAPFKLTGASWGAQIGAQSIDLVMMVMNDKGMEALRSGHFKVGAEVSGAAGPVGREAAATGGWKAGILTYSRTKGIYAGITLKGAELQQDDGATRALYGKDVNFSQILQAQAPSPKVPEAHDFVNAIEHAEQSAMAR